MSSPIDNNRPRITRSNSTPAARTEARPELRRTHSAPARVQPQPVRDGMETRAAAAPRPSVASSAGNFFKGLKDAAKSWHAGAVDTATKNALDAGASKLGVAGAAGVAAASSASTPA